VDLAGALVLALDGVSDPGNVGTLVRTADAFDAGAVLASAGTADFFGPKTLRSAMGSTFHVPVLRTPDLPARLRELRRDGALVLAATIDGENLYEVDARVPCVVLVLGSEAHGVSREVREAADRSVTVPCPGRAESLNVAAAGAISLAILSRARTEREAV
jgi:TrmH family RNA methyltransferase